METVAEIKDYLQKKLTKYNNTIHKLEKELKEQPNNLLTETQLLYLKWIVKDMKETYNELFTNDNE